MVAYQPLASFGVEPLAVEGDDTRRLLPTMLQGVQAKRDNRRRIGMAENAEDTALLAQPVVVPVDAPCLKADQVGADGDLLTSEGAPMRLTVSERPPASQGQAQARSC